jgi:hypothetical protein
MEAGFDKNDQFQHLIINPGDIKCEQQQSGIVYVATSRAKTIEHMTQETSQTKMSVLYWTGGGMSINRVIDGSTKKQPNQQGHKQVRSLKIEKRHKWVTYLIKQQELTIQTHTTKTIEQNQEQTKRNYLRTHLPHRCGGIHIHNAPKSQQEMDGTQEIPISIIIEQSQLCTEN